MKYDYIIAGSGCAGLSLLYRMLKHPVLRSKSILVLDKSLKNKNDRTWCYWENGSGLFESIVMHKWSTLQFLTPNLNRRFPLKDYSYKMIRGIDFYEHTMSLARQFENVVFKYEPIKGIEEIEDGTKVLTPQGNYFAKYVFNSTGIFNPAMDVTNTLLQHFEGWVIKTGQPAFDSNVGTFMDFRLGQENGATFMYVFPTSSTEALVEYTLFSKATLEGHVYKKTLEHYIARSLKVTDYAILHKESGAVPMSLAKFKKKIGSKGNIINMGTAGGYTKASSGYTFQFIQKHTEQIVGKLATGEYPNPRTKFRDKVFKWYDRTLLEVLISEKLGGRDIFERMFRTGNPERILAFLDHESTFKDDFRIMNSVHKIPFLLAGLKQLG